ncbi:Putative NADH-ubiquinone oxidoreductase 30.4 kDa subunit, mitochondrial [Brettanomyces nanus]|uniref:NADH-ubiquinone oxidoreductase 30.4 kDa subunit, mitochondrial n=1 Tax=Eeniella nana TaxID=13502 RepID=A0A875RY07_EENNA|nr:Putative NADH-ubiquinone oxidoreductase 30.4 kDa subunit, mitochondrial [Brettanomyces nanus]QPG77127.1 Putative NADH-ubiquinone oxidoreductase 30.4 kDa subunit, mitochondrial [Brettanomyces nanus]
MLSRISTIFGKRLICVRGFTTGAVVATKAAAAAAAAATTTGARAASKPSSNEPTYEDLPNPRGLPRPSTIDLHRPIVDPKDKYKEQSEELHKFGRYIMGCMPKFIQQFSVWKDELTVYVAPSGLRPVGVFLRDHTSAQFKACMDVTAADYPTKHNRFDVMYDLLSVRFNSRIRIKTYASEVSPVPSLVPVWPGCNWFERETYDLYGIFFEEHPDLRRILTDYGFEGHPLRKDFPTTGYTEVRYDAEKRRIVYEPLEMTQAWRNFSVGSSVWDQVGDGVDVTPADFKLPKPEIEEEEDKKKGKK